MKKLFSHLTLAVLLVLGAWATARAQILIVPFEEYASSSACRDCHGSDRAGGRALLEAVRPGRGISGNLRGSKAAVRLPEPIADPSPSEVHVQRFGAPGLGVPGVGTVASHAQGEPNLLCDSCHAPSIEPSARRGARRG